MISTFGNSYSKSDKVKIEISYGRSKKEAWRIIRNNWTYYKRLSDIRTIKIKINYDKFELLLNNKKKIEKDFFCINIPFSQINQINKAIKQCNKSSQKKVSNYVKFYCRGFNSKQILIIKEYICLCLYLYKKNNDHD